MIISKNKSKTTIEALDKLGVALADHNHQWTDEEHRIYEEACKTPRTLTH